MGKEREKSGGHRHGQSGIASAKLLYELGYDVTVNDMKTDIKGLKEELSGIEYKDAWALTMPRP
ncbi:MAG: hypothetical protein V8Q85_06935 [Christensenellales bacterium]